MNSTIPVDLLELQARFETWRANRKYVREPIPDELWSAAADFSRRYPPSLVGRTLKLEVSVRRADLIFIISLSRQLAERSQNIRQ